MPRPPQRSTLVAVAETPDESSIAHRAIELLKSHDTYSCHRCSGWARGHDGPDVEAVGVAAVKFDPSGLQTGMDVETIIVHVALCLDCMRQVEAQDPVACSDVDRLGRLIVAKGIIESQAEAN